QDDPPPLPRDPGSAPVQPQDPGATPQPQQNPPTPAPQAPLKTVFEQNLDAIIAEWKKTHKVATLGLVRDLVLMSIDHGGKLFDKGEVAGCYQTYAGLVRILTEQFGKADQCSGPARAGLVDLVGAYKRAEQTQKLEMKAWRLRFGFDKVLSDHDHTANYMLRMTQLGMTYCKRGFFADSLVAMNLAVGLQNEVLSINPNTVQAKYRQAGFLRSRVLMGLGRFKEASLAIQENIRVFKDWPTVAFASMKFYPNQKFYQAVFQKLAQSVQNNPNADPDLVFLLAHELFFAGQGNQAFGLFSQILKVNPKHLGSQCFNELSPNSIRGKRIQTALKLFVSQTPEDRRQGTNLIEKEGRWCLPFLRSLVSNQKNPADLRQRAQNLMKAMTGKK
ncbi:MAG: hypothetical protein P1V97_25205, partial [Planctomycetota bacterium]|nr:hypothetical protein [Planctomycetota bacterium]